jgi:hypothetical protein
MGDSRRSKIIIRKNKSRESPSEVTVITIINFGYSHSPARQLSFNVDEEIPEPLKGVHGGAEPVEVDLLEAERLVPGLLTVEDGFEDGGEGSDSDTSTDQETNLVREDIFTGRTKWTIHGNPEGGREDRN